MVLRRIGAVAFSAMLLTSLAACSDDGGDDGDDVSLEDADDNGSSSDDESSDDSSDDSSEDESSDDEPSLDDIGDAFDGDCLEFATAYASLGLVFLGGSFGGDTGEIDIDEILDTMDDVAADAPDDVQDAIDEVVSTYEGVFDDLGGDLDAIDFFDEDTAEALEPLNSDDFTEANDTVTAYLDEICAVG